MYILNQIDYHGFAQPQVISKRKKKLVQYLKDRGYYWSKKIGRYIDDKTTKLQGGSGIDYSIEKIDEII